MTLNLEGGTRRIKKDSTSTIENVTKGNNSKMTTTINNSVNETVKKF